MKKILLSVITALLITMGSFAQSIDNSFFDKVSYIGAFDGTIDWTAGWTEWDPINASYADPTGTKGNGQFDYASGLHLTADETWSGVIELDGWVYVDEGATLTIEAGTVIRGTEKSALIIQRGGMIMAEGTQSSPIVFTSAQGAGFRYNSDWAGLVLCGKAPNNQPGGEGIAEGGISSTYGGTVPNDNSGVLKYVRIEFPGFEVAPGSEINGLSLYSVGSGTTIDYIQVSYSGDDGYEYFGGTVNAKHLISYKTEDDDFDTDNGYSGMVQYGLVSRDPDIVDSDTANGFESDNDSGGSDAEPFTHAVFSNISAFGPMKSATEPANPLENHAGGSGMRLRRNTHLQIYNSLFAGWGRGLRLESAGSQNAASTDELTVQNCILAGIRSDVFKTDDAVMDATALETWFEDASRENMVYGSNDDVKIEDAFNYGSFDFQPMSDSPVKNASYWYEGGTNDDPASIDNSFFDHVSYIGAFDGTIDWTAGWTEWNPVDKEYADPTDTKGNGQFDYASGLHLTADETWSGVLELDGWVYVDEGATLTIEAGTVIRGTEKSALIIQRGGMIMAEGTQSSPIVFTSAQGAGFRYNSDWAGLVLCGKAPNNQPGGEGIAEGGISSTYGGTVPNDNSGVLKYVRIEFPGFEVAPGSEINGLSLYSVGSGTTIDYIQVSYSGDDGYEYFGGTVNAKHLISYKTEDDDFDTDNGYSGMVQYGLVSRDPDIVDSDTANGFESDNDSGGSDVEPFTHAVFSNISAFGPMKSATEPANPLENHAGGSGMRLRRNTHLQIYNSLFAGWGRGLRLESAGSQNAASTDELTVQNCILAGIRSDVFKTDDAVMDAAALETWFEDASRENMVYGSNDDVKIEDAFNYGSFDFQPMSDSPVMDASYWATTYSPLIKTTDMLSNYPNPFSSVTNLELQLSKQSYAKLIVFDVQGKAVATLHEGNLSEGTHRFAFDGSNLSKGLYFAKVVVGNKLQVAKMILK